MSQDLAVAAAGVSLHMVVQIRAKCCFAGFLGSLVVDLGGGRFYSSLSDRGAHQLLVRFDGW